MPQRMPPVQTLGFLQGLDFSPVASSIFLRVIQNRQHRQQKKSADDGARKRKGKRSDVIHAEGLRDEGGAPDDGAQEKNETVADLKRHDDE